MYSYEKEKSLLLKILKESCHLAQSHFPLQPEEILRKNDGSLVTVMDYACQILIYASLMKEFPEDAFLGEEEMHLLGTAEYTFFKKRILELVPSNSFTEKKGDRSNSNQDRLWVVDPIDGTRGFIHGEQYAIAIALIEKGEVVVAGLGCPRLPSSPLFIAVQGQGSSYCSLQSNAFFPLHVNKTPTEIIYCEPPANSSSHSHARAEKIVDQVFGSTQKKISYPLDSQCKYALVALGEATLYLRIPSRKREEKIWDHAPGSLIVEEAGGKVSDIHGKPLDFTQGENLLHNEGLIVSNGIVHPQIIEALL